MTDANFEFQKRVAILFKKRGAKNVQRARDSNLGIDLAMDETAQSGELIKSGVKCILENTPVGRDVVQKLYDDVQKNLKFSGKKRGYVIINGSFLRDAGARARELNTSSNSIEIVLLNGSDIMRLEQHAVNSEVSIYGTTIDKLPVTLEKPKEVTQSVPQEPAEAVVESRKSKFPSINLPKVKFPTDLLFIAEIFLIFRESVVTYVAEETETVIAILVLAFLTTIVATFWIIHTWNIPIPTGHGSILF